MTIPTPASINTKISRKVSETKLSVASERAGVPVFDIIVDQLLILIQYTISAMYRVDTWQYSTECKDIPDVRREGGREE